jgi:hypothetical protein
VCTGVPHPIVFTVSTVQYPELYDSEYTQDTYRFTHRSFHACHQ